MNLKFKNHTTILDHFLAYQYYYLPILFILIVASTIFMNWSVAKPLLLGSESYYQLSSAREAGITGSFQFFLFLVIPFLPENIVIIIPFLISLGSIILLPRLFQQLNLPAPFIFFFNLFFITSPAFILASISLSAYSFFLFLIIIGFLSWTSPHRYWKIFSLFPFAAAAGIDTFSGILLAALQLAYLHSVERERKIISWLAPVSTVLITFTARIFLRIPFLLGPFHFPQVIPDLISDLGGVSGVSFFIALLALIGVTVTWKQREFYIAYLLLPLMAIVYLFNTTIILPLTFLIMIFATVTFTKLLQRSWTLSALKKFTVLILILGILFSTLTFLDRIPAKAPQDGDQQALLWIRQNIPTATTVFSDPENSYYIHYFAGKEAVYYPHQKDSAKLNLTSSIIDAPYITTLFPLLQNNNITVLYLTPQMRNEFPADQGLLFLLKNERFKMVYSYEGSEVWVFT